MRSFVRLYLIGTSLTQLAVTAAAMSLRRFLRQGGKSYGPLLLSDSPIVAEVLALAGYGHIVVDHEHSPTDARSGQTLLQAIQATHSIAAKPTEAIVRVPGPHDPVYMKKVLDSLRLPGGVLVPMVDDAATARAVVQSTRYPLSGIRGCAVPFVRGSAYGSTDREEYLRQCQEDLLVMIQVETAAGVEAISDIAKVDGIDAIFLGPLDLSASIGKMGQFDDPDFKKLMAKAEQSIRESDCLLAGFRVPGTDIVHMFDSGYSLICGAVDLGLLRDAAHRDALAGKEAIAGATMDE
jgi:2-keto-3-deoxy-L-rhamnonate aldolase RhmA